MYVLCDGGWWAEGISPMRVLYGAATAGLPLPLLPSLPFLNSVRNVCTYGLPPRPHSTDNTPNTGFFFLFSFFFFFFFFY
jgi:hypothetical protein